MTPLDDVWADTVPYLWAMLYRDGCPRADIEDVIGDTYVRIAGRSMSNPAGYAVVTARRVHIDLVRSRRHIVDHPDWQGPATEDFADMIPDHVAQATVRRAFRRLSTVASWQHALWRCDVEDVSPGELAAELGITPDAACSLLYRARRGLRAAYLEEAA